MTTNLDFIVLQKSNCSLSTLFLRLFVGLLLSINVSISATFAITTGDSRLVANASGRMLVTTWRFVAFCSPYTRNSSSVVKTGSSVVRAMHVSQVFHFSYKRGCLPFTISRGQSQARSTCHFFSWICSEKSNAESAIIVCSWEESSNLDFYRPSNILSDGGLLLDNAYIEDQNPEYHRVPIEYWTDLRSLELFHRILSNENDRKSWKQSVSLTEIGCSFELVALQHIFLRKWVCLS